MSLGDQNVKYRLEIRLRADIRARKVSVDEPRPIVPQSARSSTRSLVCVATVDFDGPDDLVKNDRLSLIYRGEEFAEHQIARTYDIDDQRLVFRYSDWRGQLFSDVEEAVRPMIELMNKIGTGFTLVTDDRLDFGELLENEELAEMTARIDPVANVAFQKEVAW